jgi:hypothetical protein
MPVGSPITALEIQTDGIVTGPSPTYVILEGVGSVGATYITEDGALRKLGTVALAPGLLTGGYVSEFLSDTASMFPSGNPVVTQSYVNLAIDAAINDLIDGSPGTLDTLSEIAAVFNNDPDFLVNLVADVDNRVLRTGDSMSGPLTINASTVASTSGFGIVTSGGSHSLSVNTNVLRLTSYNRTTIVNNLNTVFDSNGGLSIIASDVPSFPRGLAVSPINNTFKSFVVRNAASQAASSIDVQSSAGTSLFEITGNGSIVIANDAHSNTFACSANGVATVYNRYNRYGQTSGSGGILEVAHLGGTVASPAAPATSTIVNSLQFRSGGNNAILANIPSFQLRHVIGAIGASMAEVNTQVMVTPTQTGVPVAILELLGNSTAVRIPTLLQIGASGTNVDLRSDTNNVLELRRTTSPQSFLVNNTWTDVDNYERGYIRWSTNSFRIGTEALGTGTARALQLETGGTLRFRIEPTLPIVSLGTGAGRAVMQSFAGVNFLNASDGAGLAFVAGTTIDGDSSFAFAGSSFATVSGTNRLVDVIRTFAPASGTAVFNSVDVRSTINQTGGASGITRGVNVAPTLTAAADWRSFDTNVNSGFAYYSTGTAPSRFGGNLGLAVTPTARLHVQGSGAQNTTTAVIVQNSAATQLFRVRNDGSWLFANDSQSPMLYTQNVAGTLGTVALTNDTGLVISNTRAAAGSVGNGVLFITRESTDSNTASETNFLRIGHISTNAFNPTSGTGTWNALQIHPVVNQTGGASGISRGVWINPTLTAAADWRSFDTNVNSGFAYHSSGTAPSRLGGSLQATAFEARNGASATSLLINNTWTDASNYERGYVRWSSNVLNIGSEKLGTGVARNVALQRDGLDQFVLQSASNYSLQPIFFRSASGDSSDGLISVATATTETVRFLGFGSTSRGFALAGYHDGGGSVRMALQHRSLTTYTDRFVFDVLNGLLQASGFETRNGTSATSILVNNTWTNTSNYERAYARWASNLFSIGTEALGTGSTRSLSIETGGVSRVTFGNSGGVNTDETWAIRGVRVAGSAGVTFQSVTPSSTAAGNTPWMMYTGNSTTLYIRDSDNARMHVTFGQGASSTVASTAFFSNVTIDGTVTWRPTASLTHATNNLIGIEVTSDTAGNIVYRGNDGTTRRMGLVFSTSPGGFLPTSGGTLTGGIIATELETRNATTATQVLVNNTWTDASNYERGYVRWNSNVLNIGTESLGTGVARGMDLQTVGVTRLRFGADYQIYIGDQGGNSASIFPFLDGSFSTAAQGRGLGFFSRNVVNSGISFSFSGSTNTATGGTFRHVYFHRSFSPTSGTAGYTHIDLFPIINQTGGANGTTRGLYVNPALTAAADWRSIETSNSTGWAFYAAGTAESFFGGALTLPEGTEGVPSIRGATSTTSGVFFQSNSVVFSASGSARARINQSALFMQNTMALSWSSGVIGSTQDLLLRRISAGVLGQHDAANPQTYQIYNTFTDASNYERASIGWSANTLLIGTQKLGTGVARLMDLQTDGVTRVRVGTDFQVYYGDQGTNSPSLFPFTGTTNTAPASGRGLTFYSRTIAANDLSFAFSGEPVTLTSGSANALLYLRRNFQPTSGNANYTQLYIRPVINQTGGSTGITRGIHVSPAITASADWRSVETDNNSGWAFYAAGTAPSFFGGAVQIPDGTVSLPGLSFTAEPGTGFARLGGSVMSVSFGGANRWYWTGSEMRLSSLTALSWSSSTAASAASADVMLQREAADVLALRRGANGQKFYAYNTWTDVDNYERGYMRWSGNIFAVGTEALGASTVRSLQLETNGAWRLSINASGNIAIGATTHQSTNVFSVVGGPQFTLQTTTAAVDGNVLSLRSNAVGGSLNAIDVSIDCTADVLSVLANTNATGGATQRVRVATSNTTGDSTYQALINGGQVWSWGLDNSDADSWVLSSHSILGNNNCIRVGTDRSTTFNGAVIMNATSTSVSDLVINSDADTGFSGLLVNKSSGAGVALTVTGQKSVFAASTTSYASIRLVAGGTPSSPEDGDIWYDGTNLVIRSGGTNKTISLGAAP